MDNLWAEALVAVVTVTFISFFSGLFSGFSDILIDLLRRKLSLEKHKPNEEYILGFYYSP